MCYDFYKKEYEETPIFSDRDIIYSFYYIAILCDFV